MIIKPYINETLSSNQIGIINYELKRYKELLTDKLHRCDIRYALRSTGINHNPDNKEDLYNCYYFTITYYFSYGVYNFIDREYVTKYIVTTDLSEIQDYIKKQLLCV